MAYSKIILNGETLMDVTSDTVDAEDLLSGETATKNNGTKITGTYTPPSVSNLTVTPTESQQIFNATGVYGYKPVTVNAISSTYIGTGVTTRSAADLSIWQSRITAPSGYYSSNASIYMSAYDLQVPTTSFSQTTGTFVASCSISTSGYYGVQYGSKSQSLNTIAAQTIYPSTADQTISSYRWLTGAQTIKSVTTSNLSAENIAEGVVVKVGDANNASRITQVTGTHQGGGGFTADDIAMRTISGDISGNATSIGIYAFYRCYSLTTANFPNATSIGNYAFYSCSSLTTISFPSATSIGSSAFAYCYSLTTVSFSNATSIGSYAFVNCIKLTTISFPNVTSIGSSAFYICSSLTTANFPNAITINNSAFFSCYSLTTASFPNATSIGNYVFYNCFNLLSFYLLGSSVPTLGTNAFGSTPIGGYTTSTGGVYGSIFVPSSLYNSYRTATNWSLYSARMVSV